MTLMEEAESLILHQFARAPKLKGLVHCLVKPFQNILDQFEKLHHGRYIDEAYGQRLDVLGEIVGQPRRGMSDADYRSWINVGIRLNIASGTAEDVLAILSILYGSRPNVVMAEHQPNDVVFTLLTLPKTPVKSVFDIVRSASPVTTLCHFVRADLTSPFRFDISTLEQAQLTEFFEEKL